MTAVSVPVIHVVKFWRRGTAEYRRMSLAPERASDRAWLLAWLQYAEATDDIRLISVELED